MMIERRDSLLNIRSSFNRNRRRDDIGDIRKAPSIPNNMCFSKIQAKEFLWAGYLIVICSQDLSNRNTLKAGIHTRHYGGIS